MCLGHSVVSAVDLEGPVSDNQKKLWATSPEWNNGRQVDNVLPSLVSERTGFVAKK